jgi:hypothetical protein
MDCRGCMNTMSTSTTATAGDVIVKVVIVGAIATMKGIKTDFLLDGTGHEQVILTRDRSI